jgi:hypothetical protein
LRIFKNYQEEFGQVNPKYYEFYELNPLHHFLEIEETKKLLQTKHNQLPIDPFYSHNSHLLVNIQGPYTT